MKNKKRPKSICLKIGLGQKGRKLSEKWKRNIGLANKGRKCSEKAKERMRKAHKGKHHSPQTEFKKGQIAPNKGKKFPNRSGKKHHNWKGGKRKLTQGYILLLKPKHPFCDKQGYVRKHRLVMEKMLKRFLKPYEKVHHKGTKYPLGSDENRSDNRPKNLHLYVRGKNWHPKTCPSCGFHFSIK